MQNKDTYKSFEKFLQNHAEHFTQFPSDKVWNNIRTEIHEEKRWRALLIVFMLVLTTASLLSISYNPKQNIQLSLNNLENQKLEKNLNQVYNLIDNKKIQAPQEIDVKSVLHISKEKNDNINDNKEWVVLKGINENKFSKPVSEIEENNLKVWNNTTTKKTEDYIKTNLKQTETKTVDLTEVYSAQLNNNINESKLKDVENYLNNFKPNQPKSGKQKSKWQLQIYATPSVSYRVLEDDKTRFNMPNSALIAQNKDINLNNVVHQKPAVGTEIGVALLYPISKNFFVNTGLQFNMRKYQINASEQNGIANVSLLENNTLNNTQVAAKYSTQISNNAVDLNNTMYQLSVPIGLQWNALNGERWGLIAAASIQPTFFLNKSIYAVSTDYKYYVDGTPYFRKSNMNTSIELLLSLKSGEGKFIFGPQIRYQQFSTFKDAYPIKENRIDYGIKIGFTTNL